MLLVVGVVLGFGGVSLSKNMRLTNRDIEILRQLYKWNFMLSRQIKAMYFGGQRACDRRLKILIEHGYVKRKKYIYGVPSLYTLSNSGKKLINVPAASDKIRLEQIIHNIAVIDAVIYLMKEKLVLPHTIISEKELHSIDGFSIRKHCPDIVFSIDTKKYCTECELSLKAKKRLSKIIQDNFMNYEYQIWVVPDKEHRIQATIRNSMKLYTNIKILSLEEVTEYARNIT